MDWVKKVTKYFILHLFGSNWYMAQSSDRATYIVLLLTFAAASHPWLRQARIVHKRSEVFFSFLHFGNWLPFDQVQITCGFEGVLYVSWLRCTPYLKNLVKNHRAADKNGGMICQIYTNIKVHLQVPRVKGPSGFELEKNLKNEVI